MSAKKTIRAILGKAAITDEELETTIAGAEELINSWPRTYASSIPDDMTPLTLGHFLIGRFKARFARKFHQKKSPIPENVAYNK